ncbi:MAG: RNA polymerase sigma factor [Patescibacteria group bacterium]|nr:RNA polymerase sigma factor [Patescibacteria group bacterium]
MVSNATCKHRKQCDLRSDEELVKLAKKNKSCYVCLMERYEDKMMRYVRRISGVNIETAEDIVQNVFLKVYVNLNAFKQDLKFSSWLYRIAHNETINYWRRNKKRSGSDISWDNNEALKNIIKDEHNTEQEVYQKITNEQLIETLKGMDEKYRSVLILNYLEGKSYQEIADILKKPIGTVGTLLNRAKKILKKRLKKQGLTSSSAIHNF